LKKEVLVVGTYFANPPFEYYRGAQPRGFEVALLLEIARSTGLHIKFANAYWEKLIPRLNENKLFRSTDVGGFSSLQRRGCTHPLSG
jgi:ABC-type amino acid transport substrate-binding protein